MTPYFDENGITIYCGDNREVLPCVPSVVDHVLTDPPYAIPTGIVADRPTNYQRMKGHTPQAWDNKTHPETVLSLLHRARKVVIWGGNYYPLPPSRCWLSWYKPDAPPSMSNVEYAWTNLDQNSRQISHSISATNAERVGHPTQKPLRVIRWTIEQAGVPDGAIILDPFMGSGTTGVACAIENKRFIGIEIEESYCELAVARIKRAQGIACDIPRRVKNDLPLPLFAE